MTKDYNVSENLNDKEIDQLINDLGIHGYASAVKNILWEGQSERESGYHNFDHCLECGDQICGGSICDECYQNKEIEHDNMKETRRRFKL